MRWPHKEVDRMSWHRWFAWYPVTAQQAGGNCWSTTWVWLESVERLYQGEGEYEYRIPPEDAFVRVP